MIIKFVQVPSFLNFLVSIFLCGAIIFKKFFSRASKILIALCFETFVWQLCWFISYFLTTPLLKDLIVRIAWSAIIFIPFTFYHFDMEVLEFHKERRTILLGYIFATVFLIILWFGKSLISGYREFWWGFYPSAGISHPIYVAVVLYFITRAPFLLAREIKNKKQRDSKRNKIRYVLFAHVFYYFAAIEYLINYGIGIFPVGAFFILASFTVLLYAISKDYLFDIDLAFHYGFMVSVGSAIGFGLTAGIFYFLRFLFPNIFGISGFSIILGGAIAAFFIFSARNILDKAYEISNEYILHHKYDYRKKMPPVSKEWMRVIDLGDLQKRFLGDLKEVMKFEDGEVRPFLPGDWAIGSHPAAPFLFIINPDDLDDESGYKIPKSNIFFQYLKNLQKIIFKNELEKEKRLDIPDFIKEEIAKAEEAMKNLNIAIAVPMVFEQLERVFVEGMICFDSWAGQPITELEEVDRNLFLEIAADASTAFQHALEKRKNDIAAQKKDHYLERSLEKSKQLEEELAENKERIYDILSHSSQYVTKIQLLTEEQRELDAVMQNSRAALLTIKNGRVRTANKQAENMLIGFGEKIIEKPFDEIFTDQFKDTAQIIENIKKVLKKEPVVAFETEWTKTGKPIPVEIKIIPLFEGEKVEGALIEITDISEAKEKQKLLYIKEKYETFEQLFEGLRHNLNNAMNQITLYSGLLKNSPEMFSASNELRHDFCEIMPKTAKFVSELVDSIADAHLPLKNEGSTEINIQKAIEEILVSFAERLKGPPLIKIEKKIGRIPVITAVPRHIKVCLHEIIKNSIEAIEEYDYQREQGKIPKIGGTIIIATKTNETGQPEITVSDNGIGMKEDFLNNVLNPFFTSKVHSVSHPETGTGLGLNKVYNIAKHYNGSFKIESKYGEGTTVTIGFGVKLEGKK